MLIELTKYKESGKKYAVDPSSIESISQQLNSSMHYITVIKTKTGDTNAVEEGYQEVITVVQQALTVNKREP